MQAGGYCYYTTKQNYAIAFKLRSSLLFSPDFLPTLSSLLLLPPVGMSSGQVFRQEPPANYFRYVLLCFLAMMLLPCKSQELQVLMKLKSSLVQGSNGGVFDTWIESNPVCNFSGVVCDQSSGRIKEIELSQQNLVGTLPFDSLCQLQSLEKLSFGTNFLHGRVSPDLRNCTSLQYLDLGNNSFSGEFPIFSSLVNLRFLNINLSGFSGMFPWKSLENLTQLSYLSVGDNPFDPSLFPAEVFKLTKLYWLYLTNCSLYGPIPDSLANLTELGNLEVSSNQLTGSIPASISKLGKLRQLEMYSNNLTGKLPTGFGNLTNLQNFDASTNSLEGDLSELRYLTNLASLHLFENEFSGSVPEEFGDFKNLYEMSLYTNSLSGPLPQKLGSWTEFDYIDVSENFLTGPIPPDMCKYGTMIGLLLLQNRFNGSFPENYANCSSLNRIRVSNNLLSGVVPPGIWSLPALDYIDLAMNQFEGLVGSSIGLAKSLGTIVLANNKFSGELPAELSKAYSLHTIDFSWNQFSGPIPENIGDLNRLSEFNLQSNLLSGPIPESILKCTSVTYLNLAGNLLSRKIPIDIGNLPSLNYLNLSNNRLSGHIPTSLSYSKLSLLDLSNNLLSGPVPESLSLDVYNGSFSGNQGLCSNKFRLFRPCVSSGLSGKLRAVIFCIMAALIVLVLFLCWTILRRLRRKKAKCPVKSDSWNMKSYHVLKFDEEEIIKSIKHENLIGKGASGNVYKVVLKCGQTLAVKHIWKPSKVCNQSSVPMLKESKVRSPEYEAEVATLSSIRHRNVVKLYCSISSEDSDLLVYEYSENGSLWDRLHTWQKTVLAWDVRYEIALGSARGLEYLHHGFDQTVIHRDVKSSNILLDEDLKAKIADFGLAKILQGDDNSNMSRAITGTFGYMAPEYAYTYKVNEKSDVYSFGVVLMELVTGKRPTEPEFGQNKDIVYWIYNKVRYNENLIETVDSTISEASKKDAVKVLWIAIRCTATVPSLRPSMRIVVQMLEEARPTNLATATSFGKSQSENGGISKGVNPICHNILSI